MKTRKQTKNNKRFSKAGQNKNVFCILYSFYINSKEVQDFLRLKYPSLQKVLYQRVLFKYSHLLKTYRLTATQSVRSTFRKQRSLHLIVPNTQSAPLTTTAE